MMSRSRRTTTALASWAAKGRVGVDSKKHNRKGCELEGVDVLLAIKRKWVLGEVASSAVVHWRCCSSRLVPEDYTTQTLLGNECFPFQACVASEENWDSFSYGLLLANKSKLGLVVRTYLVLGIFSYLIRILPLSTASRGIQVSHSLLPFCALNGLKDSPLDFESRRLRILRTITYRTLRTITYRQHLLFNKEQMEIHIYRT